jgi:hypothetical protein
MEPLDRPSRGTLATYGLFLLGDGAAIRRLAATPRLWLVGLLFTFSAGLAREYDAEDLLAEPWHLLIAPGASLVAATALWLFVQLSGIRRWVWSPATPQTSSTQPDTEPGLEAPPTNPPPAPRLRDSYLTFLGLFWMTAPLAWLYGIPFERFQSAGQAATSNLWLLAVIALWRVVVMIRVLMVIYGIGGVVASIIVCFFGNAVMLAAILSIPVPIFAIMGGVRLGAADQGIALLSLAGRIIGTATLLFLGLLWVASFLDRKRWSWHVTASSVSLRPLILVALAAIGWWCAWLPITQPEQQLRGQVDRALRHEDFATGLRVLASHPPEAFPPHWDPPPRIGYAMHSTPNPGDVLLFLIDHPELLALPYGNRCQSLFEDKLISEGWMYSTRLQKSRAALANLVTLLERMPDANRLMHPQLPPEVYDRGLYGMHNVLSQLDASSDPALKQRIDALLARYPVPQP